MRALLGTFSCDKIDSRNVRERELAKFDQNRRGFRNADCTLCAITMEARTRKENGRQL